MYFGDTSFKVCSRFCGVFLRYTELEFTPSFRAGVSNPWTASCGHGQLECNATRNVVCDIKRVFLDCVIYFANRDNTIGSQNWTSLLYCNKIGLWNGVEKLWIKVDHKSRKTKSYIDYNIRNIDSFCVTTIAYNFSEDEHIFLPFIYKIEKEQVTR